MDTWRFCPFRFYPIGCDVDSVAIPRRLYTRRFRLTIFSLINRDDDTPDVGIWHFPTTTHLRSSVFTGADTFTMAVRRRLSEATALVPDLHVGVPNLSKTLHIYEAPVWMRDNEYIVSGYRRYGVTMALISLFPKLSLKRK